MRCARGPGRPPKRQSDASLHADESFKKRKSMSKESTPAFEENLSPETMISNLQEVVQNFATTGKLPEAATIELKGFDVSVTTMEEYLNTREQIRELVGDSEHFDRKTELNIGVASLASARVEVDKRITTRRMSRKLHDKCGVNEEDILYKGLDYNGTESRASKELRDSRQAGIIESCVDLQKQMQWKMGIMERVKAKTQCSSGRTYPMSDGPSIRTRGGQDRQREEMKKQQKKLEKAKRNKKKSGEDPFQTPQKKVHFNALDERRIIENYQLEVASEVRTHRPVVERGIAPIPYDINILDGEEEDEEEMEL